VTLDPDTIRWRLHLRSAPEAVYVMLAEAEGRARFWAESAVEQDGCVEFRFVNGIHERSRILERQPPHRFSLEYFGSNVTFVLEPDGAGGTDLTLTDSGFDPADREELRAGWLNVLLPLKAAVDFGVDLRSHDPNRTWQDGYVDQ
jgi:uncharacterized protein YndB with AHSA1/START domain